jgi:hypothetical protein
MAFERISPGWRMDRQVTLAVLLALVVQTAGSLIWAGRAAERLDQLEHQVAGQDDALQRLARLEEQATQIEAALRRVEQKLDAR